MKVMAAKCCRMPRVNTGERKNVLALPPPPSPPQFRRCEMLLPTLPGSFPRRAGAALNKRPTRRDAPRVPSARGRETRGRVRNLPGGGWGGGCFAFFTPREASSVGSQRVPSDGLQTGEGSQIILHVWGGNRRLPRPSVPGKGMAAPQREGRRGEGARPPDGARHIGAADGEGRPLLPPPLPHGEPLRSRCRRGPEGSPLLSLPPVGGGGGVGA